MSTVIHQCTTLDPGDPGDPGAPRSPGGPYTRQGII